MAVTAEKMGRNDAVIKINTIKYLSGPSFTRALKGQFTSKWSEKI
jgi:hypothetical protein